MGHTNLLCSQTHTFSIPQSHPQTRLPPARNASQREAGGLRGTSGQVTQITRIIQTDPDYPLLKTGSSISNPLD